MSLILPSLDAFKAMSQPQRAALFVAWCSTQPPEQETHYWHRHQCPLSRFAEAMTGTRGFAGGQGFIPGPCYDSAGGYIPEDPRYVVVLTGRCSAITCPHVANGQAGALQKAATYGELVERLTAVMAAETAPQGEGQPS